MRCDGKFVVSEIQDITTPLLLLYITICHFATSNASIKTSSITAIPLYENNKNGKVSYQSRRTRASTLVTNKCIGPEHCRVKGEWNYVTCASDVSIQDAAQR